MKVLITGSVSGIGYATGIELAKKDHLVYMSVKDQKQLNELKRKITDNPNKNKIQPLILDIEREEDRQSARKLGIDVLFNNAGIGEGGAVAEIPIGLMRKNFEVNVFSSFALVQEVLKDMIPANKGKIIIMSSLSGIKPMLFLGSYCATKASIICLTKVLKAELKKINSKVKISLIEPGAYHTGFNQIMLDNKYEWMNNQSYFKKIMPEIRKRENETFNLIEKRELDSIVNKIVEAIELEDPKLVYSAPIMQKIRVKLYKIFN